MFLNLVNLQIMSTGFLNLFLILEKESFLKSDKNWNTVFFYKGISFSYETILSVTHNMMTDCHWIDRFWVQNIHKLMSKYH